MLVVQMGVWVSFALIVGSVVRLVFLPYISRNSDALARVLFIGAIVVMVQCAMVVALDRVDARVIAKRMEVLLPDIVNELDHTKNIHRVNR